MKHPTWRILEIGWPDGTLTSEVTFACPHCGWEADMPVVGLAIAQMEGGLIFDTGNHAVPHQIQCRSCRKRFEAEDPDVR